MSVEIDSISLKIESEGAQAADALGRLASSLDKLEAKSTSLSKLSSSLKKIKTAISGFKGDDVSRLASVAQSLERLSGLTAPDLSGYAKGLNALKKIDFKGLPDSLKSVTESLVALKSSGKDTQFPDMTQFVKDLRALSKVELNGVPDSLKGIIDSLTSLGENGASVQFPNMQQFVKDIRALSKLDLSTLPQSFRSIIESIVQLASTPVDERMAGFVHDLAAVARQAKATAREVKQAAKTMEKSVSDASNKKDAAAGNSVRKAVGGVDEGAPDKPNKYLSALSSLRNITSQISKEKLLPQSIRDMANSFGGVADGISRAASATTVLGRAIPIAGVVLTTVKAIASAFKVVLKAVVSVVAAVGKLAAKLPVVRDIITATKTAVSMIPGYFSRMLDPLAGIRESLSSAFKSASQFISSIKRIALYRAIRALFSSVTKDIKAGFENLYFYSQGAGTAFAGSMDAAATSMLYFRNSIAAAVSPLINALVPALQTAVNAAVTLINALNQLFAAFTGSNTWTKANISSTKAYTSSLSGANGAASELKRTLLSFDEMNVLDDNKSSGGGGGSGKTIPNYGSMFSEELNNSPIAQIGKTLRRMIDAGQWQSAGRYLSQKVTSIVEYVDSQNFGAKLGEKVHNGLLFLHGFMSNDTMWKTLGRTLVNQVSGFFHQVSGADLGRFLADQLNAALNFAAGVLETMNKTGGWAKAGRYISDIINTWFSTVDFKTARTNLVGGIKGVLDAAISFVENLDFENIWHGIATLFDFSDSDISEISEKFRKLIDDVKVKVDPVLGEIKEWFTDKWNNVILPGISTVLTTVVIPGLKAVLTTALPLVWNMLKEVVGSLFSSSAVGKLFGGVGDFFGNMLYLGSGFKIGSGLFKASGGFSSLFGNMTSSPVVCAVEPRLTTSPKQMATSFGRGWKTSIRPVYADNRLKNGASQLAGAFTSAWNRSSTNVSIGNSLSNAPSSLFRGFNAGWNSGSRTVGIGNFLKNAAGVLFSGFYGSWNNGARNVGINNSLNHSAGSLWSNFASGWGSRSVGINDYLNNSGQSLYNTLSNQWGSVRYLAVKASVQSQISPKNLFTNEQVSFAFKNGSKKVGNLVMTRMARGGIISSATLFGGGVLAGEAGKEAIVPLENHTEWLDKVAERMLAAMSGNADSAAQPIEVTVKLDGKVVGKTAVNYIKDQSKRGNAPLAGAI